MADDYKAYLLRLRRGEGQDHWRVTLVDALSGEKIRFATERALFVYLVRTLAKDGLSHKESAEEIQGEA